MSQLNSQSNWLAGQINSLPLGADVHPNGCRPG